MKISNIGIFRISLEDENVEQVDKTRFPDDFVMYLEELIKVMTSNEYGRLFKFQSNTVEVRALIEKIINDDSDIVFEKSTTSIANRLLKEELRVQKAMKHMSIEVQKGIIFQMKVSNGSASNFIICKADYSVFFNDSDGFKKLHGLPEKKKVFKGFICNIDNLDSEVTIYDKNQSTYWWQSFLETEQIRPNEENTVNAFESINKVFSNIKEKHSLDYVHLTNASIHYFRSKEVFEMNNYVESILDNYQPVDEKLDVGELKTRIYHLPNKHKFDFEFTIVKEKIRKRFIRNIPMNQFIELHLKQDIEDIDKIITSHQDSDGTKYVKIVSDEGYDFFKKNNKKQ